MPIGYKMVDGVITILEDKAELVRKVFECYVSGSSMLQISRMFTDIGVLNGNGKPSWSHGSIGNILSNVKYKGDGFYPAIIPEDLFVEAEKRRNEQSTLLSRNINYFANVPTSNYPFSGKVKCSECGAIFKRYTEHHNANKKANWKCKNYIVDNRVYCRNGVVDDRQLENAFVEIINTIIQNPMIIKNSPQLTDLLQCEGVNRLTQQIIAGINESQIDNRKMKRLIFERAALQYKNARVNDLEYQTNKLQNVLEGCMPIREFDEKLFSKTIKSITVYPTGQLRFELINEIHLDSRYSMRNERRNLNAQSKEKSSINHPAQSRI